MNVPLKNVPKTKYESFDDAWGGSNPKEEAPIPEEQTQGAQMLSLGILQHFPDHQFQLYQGSRKEQMVESIREFGILLPLVVWKNDRGDYIVLSGHNRLESAKEVGLQEVPVILHEHITPEEATLIVTETNLRQRSFSDLSHSERAHCLKQHYDAQKQQGKRSDLLTEIQGMLTGNPEKRSNTREKLASETGISVATMSRYVKIATLHKDLLSFLDEGALSFLSAYQLAFIPDLNLQQTLAEVIARGEKIDEETARLLRDDFEKTGLSHLTQILNRKQTEEEAYKRNLKTSMATVRKVVEERIAEEHYLQLGDIFEEALDLYLKAHPEKGR